MTQNNNVFHSIAPAKQDELPASAVQLPGLTETLESFASPPVYRAPFAPAYIYDWMATHSPNYPAIRQLDPTHQSYTDLTYGDWVPHIRRAGSYILRSLGKTEAGARSYRTVGADGEKMPLVIAICAHADTLDYLTTVLGIQRAGLVTHDLATNNSVDALAHLVRAAGAHHVLVGPKGNKSDLDSRLDQAMAGLRHDGWTIEMIPWPTHDTLLHGPDLDPVTEGALAPYEPDLPVAILHSSGTTGKYPKLRVLRQGYQRQIQVWPLFDHGKTEVLYAGHLPPFHAMARQVSWRAVTQGTDMLRTKTSLAIAPPALYENALQDAQLVQALQSIPLLLFGGGPMAPYALQALLKHGVNIRSIFGATELACVADLGSPLPLEVRQQDPNAIAKTSLGHAFLAPMEDEQEVEMLWFATKDFAPTLYNGSYDGVPTYSTGDKYRIAGLTVPKKVVSTLDLGDQPLYFSVMGRLDDQVPLSNGEKVNPAPILNALSASHQVEHTIVFGKARPHAGVLVQLKSSSTLWPASGTWDEESTNKAREALKPVIQQANAQTPAHAHLSLEMVLFSDPGRPFFLTGKGSVRTVPTLELYAEKVEAAYASYERGSLSELNPPTEWTQDETLEFVGSVVGHALDSDATIDVDADLFQTLGVDSLSASKVRNLLSAALSSSNSSAHSSGTSTPATSRGSGDLPTTFVYDHSTPRSLAQALVASVHGTPTESGSLTPTNPVDVMQDLIQKYTQSWPQPAKQFHPSTKHVFVVTGTTGSMGSNVLAQLVARADVESVYALNRPSSSPIGLKERQAQTLQKQGLDPSLLDSPKVQLLSVDLTAEESFRQSIGSDVLAQLEQSVTHIVHAAWRLDFNIPVQSFEAQVSTVRTLACLAMRSPARIGGARLAFLGSVARVLGMEDPPEDNVPLDVAQGGYGRSKAVSEAILASAHSRGGDTVVLRAGQLCGNTNNGAWNTNEWVPALFQASQHLGSMPLLVGASDWLPMDRASATVIDVALAKQLDGRIMHLANPQHTSLDSLLRSASEQLGLPLVKPQDWYNKLVQLGKDLDEGAYVPSALRILPFLAHITGVATDAQNPLPLLRVGKTLNSSETLRATNAVNGQDVQRWISWWRSERWIA